MLYVILMAAMLLVMTILVALQLRAQQQTQQRLRRLSDDLRESDEEQVAAFKQAVQMMSAPERVQSRQSRRDRPRQRNLRILPTVSGLAAAAGWMRDHAAVSAAVGSAAVVATLPCVSPESPEHDRPPPISQPAPPSTAMTSMPNTVVTPPMSTTPTPATAPREIATAAPAAPSATPPEPTAAPALPVPLVAVSQSPPMPVVAPVVAPDPAAFAYQPELTASAEPEPCPVQVLGLLALGSCEPG